MSELDLALPRFQAGLLEYGGGLANHGPMAAEALEVLGHEALVPAFVDVYAPRLGVIEVGTSIDAAGQGDALGSGRDADWVATFLAAFDRSTWRDVLEAWLPTLLPGLFAAATHGALRTAHAVRAVHAHETEPRIREIAYGLAYWASHYQELPGAPASAPVPGMGPAALLNSLEPLPQEDRRYGFFDAAVVPLDDSAAFKTAVARLDVESDEPSMLISEICATAAGFYLAHPEFRIAYAHCVTGPSAVRLLADHLEPERVRAGIGYAVQVVAALHSVHVLRSTEEATQPDAETRRLAGDADEMRYRAACSAEEHSIKLCEACLREDAVRPDPRLRLAGADAAISIGRSAGSRGA